MLQGNKSIPQRACDPVTNCPDWALHFIVKPQWPTQRYNNPYEHMCQVQHLLEPLRQIMYKFTFYDAILTPIFRDMPTSDMITWWWKILKCGISLTHTETLQFNSKFTIFAHRINQCFSTDMKIFYHRCIGAMLFIARFVQVIWY